MNKGKSSKATSALSGGKVPEEASATPYLQEKANGKHFIKERPNFLHQPSKTTTNNDEDDGDEEEMITPRGCIKPRVVPLEFNGHEFNRHEFNRQELNRQQFNLKEFNR